MKKMALLLTATAVGIALNGASALAQPAHAWWAYSNVLIWRGGW
jgi:hypothetical protein